MKSLPHVSSRGFEAGRLTSRLAPARRPHRALAAPADRQKQPHWLRRHRRDMDLQRGWRQGPWVSHLGEARAAPAATGLRRLGRYCSNHSGQPGGYRATGGNDTAGSPELREPHGTNVATLASLGCWRAPLCALRTWINWIAIQSDSRESPCATCGSSTRGRGNCRGTTR